MDYNLIILTYGSLSHIWAAVKTYYVGMYRVFQVHNLCSTWSDGRTAIDRHQPLATLSNLLHHNGNLIVILKQVEIK